MLRQGPSVRPEQADRSAAKAARRSARIINTILTGMHGFANPGPARGCGMGGSGTRAQRCARAESRALGKIRSIRLNGHSHKNATARQRACAWRSRNWLIGGRLVIADRSAWSDRLGVTDEYAAYIRGKQLYAFRQLLPFGLTASALNSGFLCVYLATHQLSVALKFWAGLMLLMAGLGA